MRGLIDRKGEQFAYLQGDTLFTLDGEATGRLRDGFIEDMGGNPIWRVVGDGVYTLNSSETIGYFGDERSDQYDL
ncbi:hypothetical protein MNBD_CHLOROFLEXI01-2517 [hydrothermal vent metagenome]|uniref:Uncharacterized protein n=1 Tax=hydrothermal vent metagenome TaxID=652676 RepID=A0A3B0UN21_9ZZZZ